MANGPDAADDRKQPPVAGRMRGAPWATTPPLLRRAVVLLLALASVVPASTAATLPETGPLVSFSSPAQAVGALHLNATFVVFVLDDDGAGTLDVAGLVDPVIVNHTSQAAISSAIATGATAPVRDEERIEPLPAGDALRLDARPRGRSTLIIEADRIALASSDQHAGLMRDDGNAQIAQAVPTHEVKPTFRDVDRPAGVALQAAGGATWSIEATGLQRVEWFRMATTCASGPCPSEGGRSATSVSYGALATAQMEEWGFVELTTSGGSVTGALRATAMAAGAPAVALTVDGLVRLPVAAGATSCATCEMPDGKTLTATGLLTMADVRPDEDGRLAATVGGDLATLRYDEAFVPTEWIENNPVVATAAGAGILGALGLLASRLVAGMWRVEKPLDHPRRSGIAQYVIENPGSTFREVARAQNLAAGTARHHLNVLIRSKVLVEHRHQGTVRIFENHGKYNASWRRVVALRDPELSLIHEFVASQGRVHQKDILDHFEARGWNRSTTQHRLARLERSGVLSAMQQGRWKFYAAASDPPKPAVPQHAGLPEWAVRSLQRTPGIASPGTGDA